MFLVAVALKPVDDKPVGINPGRPLPVPFTIEPERAWRNARYRVCCAEHMLIFEELDQLGGPLISYGSRIKRHQRSYGRYLEQLMGHEITGIILSRIGIP